MNKIYQVIDHLGLYDTPPPLTTKAIASVKGMLSVLENRGHQYFSPRGTTTVDKQYITELERIIIVSTEGLLNQSNREILRYFNSVQLWGGITGRNIYLRGALNENLDLENYRDLIRVCKEAVTPTEVMDVARSFNLMTRYIGYAFITKHIRFLTTVNHMDLELPIYDSIIAKGVYGKATVSEKDIPAYWNEMIGIAHSKKVSVRVLERALFNFLRG